MGRRPLALAPFRSWLQRQPVYLDARWNWQEGIGPTWRRLRLQRQILRTPPIRTASEGSIEVRSLTWRRDWINTLWALKSFYHFADVNYPLYLHDGGLQPSNCRQLRRHFPDAHIIGATEADDRVDRLLKERGLPRCVTYRSRNIATRKLFDFFALSTASHIISIDADIVFFQRPNELCHIPTTLKKNFYNRDENYWYSMSPEELQRDCGIVPPPFINSGLSLICRESIDFVAIEQWLANSKLADDKWVSEQTLHALCSAQFGVELLPDSYRVSTQKGLTPELVCKHYPGFFRPLFYGEGMAHLIQSGFLKALRFAAR